MTGDPERVPFTVDPSDQGVYLTTGDGTLFRLDYGNPSGPVTMTRRQQVIAQALLSLAMENVGQACDRGAKP